MDLAKVDQILSLMRRHGCEHFKTTELEVKMSVFETSSENKDSQTQKSPGEEQHQNSRSPIPEPQAIPPIEMKIPHHLNEVTSLLKLSDEQLVDKLFPDYTKQQPSEQGVTDAQA